MNWKNNKAFLVSLVILILAGIGLGLAIIRPWMRVKKNTSYLGNQIDRFCINATCLQKNNNTWLVVTGTGMVPADSEVVDSYVNKLENIQFGDVISTNLENFSNLGIGISKVVISANGKSLEIGKVNSNYDGTYAREADTGVVYNMEMIIEKNNLSDPKKWINKTLTNLSPAQTKKISISINGRSKDIILKNGIWDDLKWVEKVDSLTAIDYLEGFIPGNESKTIISVETESTQVTITLGKNILNKNAPVFWVTTDGKYYYSLVADDYNLLTGKIK